MDVKFDALAKTYHDSGRLVLEAFAKWQHARSLCKKLNVYLDNSYQDHERMVELSTAAFKSYFGAICIFMDLKQYSAARTALFYFERDFGAFQDEGTLSAAKSTYRILMSLPDGSKKPEDAVSYRRCAKQLASIRELNSRIPPEFQGLDLPE